MSVTTGRPYTELSTAYLYKERPGAAARHLRLQRREELLGHRRQPARAGTDRSSPGQRRRRTEADGNGGSTGRSSGDGRRSAGPVVALHHHDRPSPFARCTGNPGGSPGRRDGRTGSGTGHAGHRNPYDGDSTGRSRARCGWPQGQGRRASVPSRPSRGNRSASSGPDASPVSASRSGMKRALPLRPVASFTAFVQSLPGLPIPRLGRQQIEGLAHELDILLFESAAFRAGPRAGCATRPPRGRACRCCRAPPSRTARPPVR